MNEQSKTLWETLDLSAIVTVIGIIILFSGAVIVTLIAPSYVDPSWTQASSPYQVQMYEISDPNFYISSAVTGGQHLQFVHHLKDGLSLLAFQESDALKIKASKELEKYVTKADDKVLKLTSKLLLLRPLKADGTEYELYVPDEKEAFTFSDSDGIVQNWIDQDFQLLDKLPEAYHPNHGVIYVLNPFEYRVKKVTFGNQMEWRYDPAGESVKTIQQLTEPPLGFRSRKQLIEYGEHIFAVEGCWYCHTDQTRTLVQDVVLNGSAAYPAPPSSANEYIFQKITFPGTKRNGPDLSRVGIKRPNRDWHKAHFWFPRTASPGSIMPAFRHFFDFDPRGTSKNQTGVPNYKFEAIFQYLMTKGTRITSPNQSWWLGKDPVNTIEIIEGRKVLP